MTEGSHGLLVTPRSWLDQGIVTGFDGVLEVMDLDTGAGFRASFPAAAAPAAVMAAPAR